MLHSTDATFEHGGAAVPPWKAYLTFNGVVAGVVLMVRDAETIGLKTSNFSEVSANTAKR